MKYCQYCGAMLEDGAQCTCPDAQRAQGSAEQQPDFSQQPGDPQQSGYYQQPDGSQQAGYYQQPDGSQQPGYYQQPGGSQQSGYYQQPGGFQQPGYYQQPGDPQQPGYYQQPSDSQQSGYYQQPGYFQQPGDPQQPGYYQQPGYSQQRADAQRKMSDAQKKAKAAANGLWSYLKRYFASPAEAVQGSLTQDGMMVSIILTVIRVLSVWLAVYGVLHKICSMASAAIGSTLGLFSGGLGMKISAPIFGSLLYGALIAVICMGLFILGVFAVAKIQKGDLSLCTAWQASANNSVLPTALLLLSFLVSFISLSIALVLIVLSVLASLTCGVLTAQYVYNGNKSGVFWLLFFVAVIVIAIITYYIVPMLALKAVGGIAVSYGGETQTLGAAIDEMQKAFASGGGLEGILEEIMDSVLY